MIAKRVSIVTILTVVNLVVTMLNQVVLAYLFGAGTSMDAFLACGAVPFVILNLAIGDLGYVLVPLLMRSEENGELDSAVNSSFTAVGLLSFAVTVFGMAGHRWILHLTTASTMPVQTFDLAASIAPVMWAVIGLTIMGSYLTGVHYYRRSFSLPSVTLALPYLGMIAGGLIGAKRWGIFSVVLGWAAGTLLRDIILYVTLRGPWARLCRNILHPVTLRMAKSLPLLGISLLPFAAFPMIDVYWASRLPVGSISYLGYSNRIVIALTSIAVQGLSVVMFPDLSEDISKGRTEAFRLKVIGVLKMIFLAMVPMAVLVALVRMPMLEIMLQRGKFTVESSLGVARVLPFYLLGVIWMAMMNIVIRGFYALQDYKTPAKIGVAALALYAILSGIFTYRFSYLGIGIAYFTSWVFMFFMQTYFLGRTVGVVLNRDFLGFLGKVLASSLVALGIPTAIVYVTAVKTIAASMVEGACAVILFFFVTHYVFKFPQYISVFRVIQRKFAHRPAV